MNADTVVSDADLEYYRLDAAASVRARAIGELLRYDLDGDGVVARAEVVKTENRRIRLETRQDPTRNSLGEFLVHKKIRFPAGLHGAHLVRFRIQKGTPMPEGDPGHSCVIVEGTGMPLYNGATCDGPFGLKR